MLEVNWEAVAELEAWMDEIPPEKWQGWHGALRTHAAHLMNTGRYAETQYIRPMFETVNDNCWVAESGLDYSHCDCLQRIREWYSTPPTEKELDEYVKYGNTPPLPRQHIPKPKPFSSWIADEPNFHPSGTIRVMSTTGDVRVIPLPVTSFDLSEEEHYTYDV